jgi:Ca2+-binding RTX toxin-like protein
MKDMEIAEVYGKRGNDTISGPFLGLRLTSLRIFGGPGSDDLHGAGGRDLLLGGPGEDVLNGGRAADRVFGGPAGDTIADRDSSDDALYGGNLLSSEGCSAVHGIDTITSQGPGADRVFGGNLNGRVVCHDGPDVLSVADGTAGDTVVGDNRGSGGVAADTIAADPGDKIFRNNDLRR